LWLVELEVVADDDDDDDEATWGIEGLVFTGGAVNVEDLVTTVRLIADIAAAPFAEVSDTMLLVDAAFCVDG
jgi:hypothetical protein